MEDFIQKYYVNRRNSHCYKWDVQASNGEIGMAIADMDFKTDERIIKSLTDQMAHGAYGYTVLADDYYDEMINFNKRRHHINIEKEWIRFSTGAVEGLYQVVNALTNENDGVLIFSPAYMPFYHCLEDTNRKTIISKLIKINDRFEMDFSDIEEKFKNGDVKLAILCSPHNPTGRIWQKDELDKYFMLADKYDVLTISDEVHADIIMPNHTFISALQYQQYFKNIIVLNSVSKTFNLAMFSHSHIIVPNESKRLRLDEYRKRYHREVKGGFNSFASYYGYKYGDNWLDCLNKVIFNNYQIFKNRLPELEISPLEGTYLVFVNLSDYCKGQSGADLLKEKCHVIVNDGKPFGEDFAGWVRFNLATKPEFIEQACEAIRKIIK